MLLAEVSNNLNNTSHAQILDIAALAKTMQTNVTQILIQPYGDTLVIILIMVF